MSLKMLLVNLSLLHVRTPLRDDGIVGEPITCMGQERVQPALDCCHYKQLGLQLKALHCMLTNNIGESYELFAEKVTKISERESCISNKDHSAVIKVVNVFGLFLVISMGKFFCCLWGHVPKSLQPMLMRSSLEYLSGY